MKAGVGRAGAASSVDIVQGRRASNRRTAWILVSVAVTFFAGIIATRWIGGGTVGVGVMGAAILAFLVVAIGRNLRRARMGDDDTAVSTPSGRASQP